MNPSAQHGSMARIVLPEPGLIGLPFLRDEVSSGATIVCHASDAQLAEERFPGCDITTYDGGSLTPSRNDLPTHEGEAVLVRDAERQWSWDSYVTTLGVMGTKTATIISQEGRVAIEPPYRPDMQGIRSLALVACGGIGNIIQATPLLRAARNAGLATAFCPVSDGGESLGPLFEESLDGVDIVTPDELSNLDVDIRLNIECRAHMQAGEFFHSPYREPMDRHEAEAYAHFFENVTGISVDPAATSIGGRSIQVPDRLQRRVVLCPGSKPGWDSKRWPHFGELAEQLDDPVILCRETDLDAYERLDFLKPMQCDNATVVTDASLAEAAAILRSAKGVIANDCGLAHMAAAAGTPTLALFGPSSLAKNRPLRANALSLSLCLECQPCQGRADGPGRLGPGDYSCNLGYCCLEELTVDRVMTEALELFNQTHGTSA